MNAAKKLECKLQLIEGGMGDFEERERKSINSMLKSFLEDHHEQKARGITLEIVSNNVDELKGDFVGLRAWQKEHEERDDERIGSVKNDVRELRDEVREMVGEVAERVTKLEVHREHTESDVDKLEKYVTASGSHNVDAILADKLDRLEKARERDVLEFQSKIQSKDEQIDTLKEALATIHDRKTKYPSDPVKKALALEAVQARSFWREKGWMVAVGVGGLLQTAGAFKILEEAVARFFHLK